MGTTKRPSKPEYVGKHRPEEVAKRLQFANESQTTNLSYYRRIIQNGSTRIDWEDGENGSR